jgi:CRP-like cAMP-binding protein
MPLDRSPTRLTSNNLLAILSPHVLELLEREFELHQLPVGEELYERGKNVTYVHFPVAGVASMVSSGSEGETVEVATIGCEGMVGLPLVLGSDQASEDVFMQVPGAAFRMNRASFKRHLERQPELSRLLLLYTQTVITQIAQSSACNRLHEVERRCARWLLQTHDRITGDEFELTQEFLGLMLGVRRATVTRAAGVLQRRRRIRYHRGVITVLDRAGLEKDSCPCYSIIATEYRKLIHPARTRSMLRGA